MTRQFLPIYYAVLTGFSPNYSPAEPDNRGYARAKDKSCGQLA